MLLHVTLVLCGFFFIMLHLILPQSCLVPVWAREHGRINLHHFMAKCRKKRLNQASFVLRCFALFAFSGLFLASVLSICNLSSVLYFPA